MIVVREVNRMNGKNFIEAKAMSVESPKRWPDCRGCQKGRFRGQRHTERETLEQDVRERGQVHQLERVL